MISTPGWAVNHVASVAASRSGNSSMGRRFSKSTRMVPYR
jgi:hypothetical protein